jgi:hypothetical protein
MVGAVTTGLLGTNLIAEADAPVMTRLAYLFVATVLTALFMLYAILKSKQLSDVMDVLSDDQRSLRARFGALGTAWKRSPK